VTATTETEMTIDDGNRSGEFENPVSARANSSASSGVLFRDDTDESIAV
jgi:hypothetical protein